MRIVQPFCSASSSAQWDRREQGRVLPELTDLAQPLCLEQTVNDYSTRIGAISPLAATPAAALVLAETIKHHDELDVIRLDALRQTTRVLETEDHVVYRSYDDGNLQAEFVVRSINEALGWRVTEESLVVPDERCAAVDTNQE